MRRSESETIRNLENKVARLERETNVANHRIASKIKGSTSELTSTGRQTRKSWANLEDLLKDMIESVSEGYVVMNNKGEDERVAYRFVTLYEDGKDLVLTGTPREEDEDEPRLQIHASLESLLGHGAKIPKVVDVFREQVEKRLSFYL